MGRNKSDYKIHDTGTFNALNPDRYGAAKQGNDPWKRKRKERPDESAYNLPKLDVHGVLLLRKLRLQPGGDGGPPDVGGDGRRRLFAPPV